MTSAARLPALLFAYVAASFLHHAHNAWYLTWYPNMPRWLSPAGVMLAWSIETAIGMAGYAPFTRDRRTLGSALIGLYAAAGLGGLDHYTLAPMTHHSFAMNVSIWVEVATAAMLLLAVLFHARQR